jgi:hypothetical protein
VSDLAIYIKKYLKGKKKNYGNSNVSLVTQKNIISTENPLKETKILQDIIRTL